MERSLRGPDGKRSIIRRLGEQGRHDLPSAFQEIGMHRMLGDRGGRGRCKPQQRGRRLLAAPQPIDDMRPVGIRVGITCVELSAREFVRLTASRLVGSRTVGRYRRCSRRRWLQSIEPKPAYKIGQRRPIAPMAMSLERIRRPIDDPIPGPLVKCRPIDRGAIEGESSERVASEAADVLYHVLVGLRLREVPLREVVASLLARAQKSGHEEKASRQK
jgi:hypothetical protein